MVSSKSENSLAKKSTGLIDKMSKRRGMFLRQKSFEIDSDSTDIDASLTPSSEKNQQVSTYFEKKCL